MLRSCGLVREIMFLPETAVPVKKRCRSAGTEKYEVSFEARVVDESSAFKRGEDGAFGLREPKTNFDERVGYERGIDGNEDLFKAGVLKRRDGNCFATAREVGKFLGRDEIYLVQYLDDGLGRDAKLG
jgi:hypothetical protein